MPASDAKARCFQFVWTGAERRECARDHFAAVLVKRRAAWDGTCTAIIARPPVGTRTCCTAVYTRTSISARDSAGRYTLMASCGPLDKVYTSVSYNSADKPSSLSVIILPFSSRSSRYPIIVGKKHHRLDFSLSCSHFKISSTSSSIEHRDGFQSNTFLALSALPLEFQPQPANNQHDQIIARETENQRRRKPTY